MVKADLERHIDQALRRSPAQPLFAWRASRRLVVLAYHEIEDPARFARQVAYLRRSMRPVSLDDVVAACAGVRALPRRAVLITFDDGDRSVYDRAWPILREQGVPALAFIIAGLLDTDRPFWWREVEHLCRAGVTAPGLPADAKACCEFLKRVPDAERRSWIASLRERSAGPPLRWPQLRAAEVAEMASSGIAVGNHTYSHPCLDQCSGEQIRDEIVQAHDRLTAVVGSAPVAFSYPNGNVDARAVPVLEKLGYAAAFLFDHRIASCPPADRFRISRVRVASSTSMDRFRIIVSGLHPTIHRLIGRR